MKRRRPPPLSPADGSRIQFTHMRLLSLAYSRFIEINKGGVLREDDIIAMDEYKGFLAAYPRTDEVKVELYYYELDGGGDGVRNATDEELAQIFDGSMFPVNYTGELRLINRDAPWEFSLCPVPDPSYVEPPLYMPADGNTIQMSMVLLCDPREGEYKELYVGGILNSNRVTQLPGFLEFAKERPDAEIHVEVTSFELVGSGETREATQEEMAQILGHEEFPMQYNPQLLTVTDHDGPDRQILTPTGDGWDTRKRTQGMEGMM